MGVTRFNVGDILVGTDDENYAITNSHTLVQVLSVDYGERPRMEVIVFDRDTATYLFCDEEAAKKFLRDNFNQEVRIDIEENGWDTISEISDDGWEAKITNRFVDHDDITELFISPIYQ